MSRLSKHLVIAVLVGLGLRLFFIWRFPTFADDTRIYDELERNWADHGVYGLWIGGNLTPVDIRVPGYPAFLAAIYAVFGHTWLAVKLAQAALDLLTCFLTAALAAFLAPEARRQCVAIAALWLAATCPFLANYTAVPLTEVLTTFLTSLALLVFAWREVARRDLPSEFSPDAWKARRLPFLAWLLAGLCVGLGALVRPETPLLLVAVALVLAVRWRRPSDWPKVVRAGVLMTAGLVVPLLPWAARNWHTLHRVQFLAPRYAELPDEYVPRGFYAWTKTWLVRFRDVYLVPWKLEEEPIRIEDLPASAFDSVEERARVAALLEQHNQSLSVSPELNQEFADLARERTARHPLRTYLWVPLGRAATLWFTPRIELLPFSGRLWPPGRQWEEDPVDFSVTVVLGLLNFWYVGLALAGAWWTACRQDEEKAERRWALALLVAFILVRTGFLTQVETPEPRYVLECFPALLALAAQIWAKTHACAAP